MGSDGGRGSHRGFWSLIVTQFQGAFSDNALKFLVTFWVLGLGLPQETRDALVSRVGLLFAIPFILFSMFGGFLADRFSKRSVIIGVRFSDLPVMITPPAGLATGRLWLAITAMVLMSVHSAIFAAPKYGILPEMLSEKELSWGNGILELGTFIAIILGTVGGGWMFETFQGRQHWSGGVLVGLALFGLMTCLGIEHVPAANPTKRFQPNILVALWTQ